MELHRDKIVLPLESYVLVRALILIQRGQTCRVGRRKSQINTARNAISEVLREIQPVRNFLQCQREVGRNILYKHAGHFFVQLF